MEATQAKCSAKAFGLTCQREEGHPGQHRGYNEQIDEPMFWPVLKVRNEVVQVVAEPVRLADYTTKVWVAAEPAGAGGHTVLGWHSGKAEAASLCRTADAFIFPVGIDQVTVTIDPNHPEAEHPLAPKGYGHGH